MCLYIYITTRFFTTTKKMADAMSSDDDEDDVCERKEDDDDDDEDVCTLPNDVCSSVVVTSAAAAVSGSSSSSGSTSCVAAATTTGGHISARVKFSSDRGQLFAVKKARTTTTTVQKTVVPQASSEPHVASGCSSSSAAEVHAADESIDCLDETYAPSSKKKSYKTQRLESAPLPLAEDGDVLDHRDVADTDELYEENEIALTKFIKLHPMLSLDATNERTLSAVAELAKDVSVKTKELEVVTKTYDDDFLRPANADERECVNGAKCVCRWLSIFRYGEASEFEFVCREYVLPSETEAAKAAAAAPPSSSNKGTTRPHGKCLLCTRYFTTYIYTLARNTPTFCPKSPISLQAFANKISVSCPQDEALSHSSSVGTTDGYRQAVMLFVDEKWTDTKAARDDLGTIRWKPMVRFNSKDYSFVIDTQTNAPRIVQVDMGHPATDQGFYQPSSSRAVRVGAEES